MDGPGRRSRRSRRWRRALAWVAGVLALLIAIFYLGGGWYFSGVIDDRALDGAARRASTEPDYSLEILSVGTDTITVRTPEDPGSLEKDGVWGLRWEGGYGQVGSIVATPGGAEGSVERRFTLLDGAPPEPGVLAELDVRAYPNDPGDTGLAFEDVAVRGPLGEYPAWSVQGRGDVWALVVHGNSMSRLDGLRAVPILADAHLPILVVTFRNDAGAPEDPSGKLRYGLTEWRDLEAAARYALEHGARGLVLVGYSMGGGVIAAFLQRSDLADRVEAVVLDAPMLDFSTTVDDNASRETLPLLGLPLPSSLTAVAKWMAGWRFGVDWEGMNYLAQADVFDVPFLVFHGTSDTTVPIGTSEEFLRLRPDLVTLVRCPEAEHIECWNLDPDAYAAKVSAFLDGTLGT